MIGETNKEISCEIQLKREMAIFAMKGKPLKAVMGKGTRIGGRRLKITLRLKSCTKGISG